MKLVNAQIGQSSTQRSRMLGSGLQRMGKTLLQKVWDLHTVRHLPTGQTQLFIGLHLVHEVTSPQAFDALRTRGWTVARPDRTFATVDHIVPTRDRQRPFLDVLAEDMISAL